MGKIKVRCIEKLRDNSGSVVAYTLQTETGDVFQANSADIKKELKGNKYEFVNLQLDSIGRLVDKVDKDARQHEAINRAFYEAYNNLLQGKEIEFGRIDFGNKFFNTAVNHNITGAYGDNEQLAEEYMTGLLHQFERFVLQSGGPIPYKLQVKSRDGVFERIHYSLGNPEIEMTDYIKKDLKRKAIYYNPENYMIRAYMLNTPNQLLNNVYVAPDMSIVSVKQQVSSNQRSGQSMKHVDNTKPPKQSDTILFMKSFVELFDKIGNGLKRIFKIN